MTDTTRLPTGILITSDLAKPLPVGTIVLFSGDNQLYRSIDSVIPSYEPISGGGTSVVDDDNFRIVHQPDPTRMIAFSAGTIAPGETRRLTMSNFDFSLQTQGLFPPNHIDDPGDGGTLATDASGRVIFKISFPGEWSTISHVGVTMGTTIYIATSGTLGNRTLNFSLPFDPMGHMRIEFAPGNAALIFHNGATWRLLLNEGATLL